MILSDTIFGHETILGHVNSRGFFRPCWTRLMSAILFVAAAVLPAFPAHGMESPIVRQVNQGAAGALPLPPILHLETTPWLDWAPIRNGLKIDTLQLPRAPFDGRAGEDFCRRAALPMS